MTEQQKEQFKLFGCIPRCIIELAQRMGEEINADKFSRRFIGCFSNPATQFGLFDEVHLPRVLRELKLATGLRVINDYDEVKQKRDAGLKVLVYSGIDLNSACDGVRHHCSILESMDAGAFKLWTPTQDGNAALLRCPVDWWASKNCSGWVLEE